MKTLTKYALSALAFALLFAACGGNTATEEQKAAEKAAEEIESAAEKGVGGLAEAAKQLEEAAQNMKGESGEAVEPVDFRTLKALLPSSVNGMSLQDASGEKTGVMGFKVSSAKGSYKSGDGKVDLNITDMGGVSGVVSMMAAWTMVSIDKEDDNGYEKTGTYNGYKSIEKYNTKNKNGELSILVNNRFMVQAQGDNVDMSVIKKTLDAVDLKKLSAAK